MKEAGQIVLFRFPQTGLQEGKSRPALLIAKVPGNFDDWLTCMVSTQLQQAIEGFDEIISLEEPDFVQSGLKATSVIRVGRVGVLSGDIFDGAVGTISAERLQRIKSRIAKWIKD